METKRTKVVELITGEPSCIISRLKNYAFDKAKEYIKEYNPKLLDCKDSIDYYKHLYFLSDEEIKEGDWIYNSKENIVEQIKSNENLEFVLNHNLMYYKSLSKLEKIFYKIIATTDKSLKITETIGHDGTTIFRALPQPSQAFVEKYCKLGGIDEVLVEYTHRTYEEWVEGDMNPKDYEKLKVDSHNTITIHLIKNSWSREENVRLASKILHDASKAGYFNMPSFREKAEFENNWINENL